MGKKLILPVYSYCFFLWCGEVKPILQFRYNLGETTRDGSIPLSCPLSSIFPLSCSEKGPLFEKC